jgi:hypothetical protein
MDTEQDRSEFPPPEGPVPTTRGPHGRVLTCEGLAIGRDAPFRSALHFFRDSPKKPGQQIAWLNGCEGSQHTHDASVRSMKFLQALPVQALNSPKQVTLLDCVTDTDITPEQTREVCQASPVVDNLGV